MEFMEAGMYTSLPLPFDLGDIAPMEAPRHVLLCDPGHFDIVDEKNVHMQGQAGNVDKTKAQAQWTALRDTYIGLRAGGILAGVEILPGAAGCEDMVFCANQSFPWQLPGGERIVVMSWMRHASRQREVGWFEDFFQKKGFRALHLSGKAVFEGMGDVIPHPGKRLLYGGYGHRTSTDAYPELSALTETPVIALKLVNPRFYHLDTCFLPLSEDTVMICAEAFDERGLSLIRTLFPNVLQVPEDEAVRYFPLNAHVLDLDGKRYAILQQGAQTSIARLKELGFTVIELDTSEFMKSGGSVFCMKMMYP